MKTKTITITKGNGITQFNVSDDGWARVMIDIYYFFEGSQKLVELMEEQTGVKWTAFGCFMDNCCLATKEYDKLPDTFEFTYPWKE